MTRAARSEITPAPVEDATKLWRLHGHVLSAGRIQRVLSLIEEALGQSDLLPLFESVQHGST